MITEVESEEGIQFATPHPKLVNGMLKFESKDHLRSYFADLNNYIFEEMKNSDADSLLLLLETQLGHNSLLPILNSPVIDLDLRNGDEVDYIHDELRMLFLNEHYEVQLGDSIYVYQTENLVLKFHNNDETVQDKIRSIDKGNDDYVSRELLQENVSIESRKHFIKRSMKPPSGSCSITQFNLSSTPADCIPGASYLSTSAYMTRQFNDGTVDTDGSGYLSGNWLVDWGDDQTDEFTGSGADGLIHYYETFGSYTITVGYIAVNPCDGAAYFDEEEEVTVVVGENNCVSPNMYEMVIDVPTGSGSHWMMIGELWAKHDFFGNHQVAKTTSYHWESNVWGNYSWHTKAGPIYAKLYYDFRKSNNCNLSLDSGSETDQKPNKSSVRAAQSRGWTAIDMIPDDEIHSIHWSNANGNYRDGELMLDVCE